VVLVVVQALVVPPWVVEEPVEVLVVVLAVQLWAVEVLAVVVQEFV